MPLSRHVFAAPTYHYKTGVVFLAWLAGHQDHFTMVGGFQSGRSPRHLIELMRLADAAGLLPNAELAAYRARAFLTTVAATVNRFSFNQATAKYWPLPDLVAGLSVTSLCRGGFFSIDGWYDENRRAIDEAAALGAPALLLVSGGLPDGSRDVDAARARVGAALGMLVPHALAAGVRLAVEPLHPMFCADRCVVATLGQALDLAAPYPAEAVGVAIDTYHLWWDAQVWTQIARAGREGRIACFQVADWVTPLPEGVLLGRGLPGEGCVELRRFREAVDAAGYSGPIEVEVFHADVWARPGPDVLAASIAGYLTHVA